MRQRRSGLHGWWARAALPAALPLLAACGAKYVWVAPRLDLQPHSPVGLVTFTIEGGQGTLHEVATRRFAEAAFAGQENIEILELGAAEDVLAAVARPSWARAPRRPSGRRATSPRSSWATWSSPA